MRRLELLGCSVDMSTGALSGGRSGRLTTRELDLLRYLAGRREAVDRRKLLCQVFGYRPNVASRAVDKAMNSLRAKIERDPAEPEHLITVQGVGYRFVPKTPPAAPQPSSSPLLFEPDRFVGHTDTLAELAAALRAPGLVTVVGTGGLGKTRLARRAARLYAEQTGEQARLCELVEARTADDLLRVLASSLGLSLQGRERAAADRLGHALDAMGPVVVILDNLEQLVEHRGLIERWRALAPRARLLGTSRRPLELAGERVLPLRPLNEVEAVELLTERAASGGLQVDGLELLARHLEGLPLALELAAVRLRTLGPAQILARLRDRLDLLKGPRDEIGPLRRALDWSWALLPAAEKTALAELSVFAGGISIEAAEVVLDPDPAGRPTVDLLDALVSASLLVRRPLGGSVRLEMLETIRGYARERLQALGPEQTARIELAHAAWFAQKGTREHLRGLTGPSSREVRQDLIEEGENLFVACRRSIRHGRPELAEPTCAASWTVLRHIGVSSTAVELTTALLEMDGLDRAQRARIGTMCGEVVALADPRRGRQLLLRALTDAHEAQDPELVLKASRNYGSLLRTLGELEDAVHTLEHGLTFAESDGAQEGLLLRELSLAVAARGDLEQAISLCERALQLHHEAGYERGVALVRGVLALYLMETGRLLQAEEHMQAALQTFLALGERAAASSTRGNLGMLAARRGDLHAAAQAHLASAQDARAAGDLLGEASSLQSLVGALLVLEELERARTHLDRSEALAGQLGDVFLQARGLRYRGGLYLAQGHPEEALSVLLRSEELLRGQGQQLFRMYTLSRIVEAHRQLGNLERAQAVLDEVVQWADAHVQPGSELAKQVTELRASLDQSSSRYPSTLA
jgi:predicted ATPase/DNA-binding winged helix-turn-helix (wHTH) protein